jgi:hypothetical protein
MSTTNTSVTAKAASATLKAYEDKISAQLSNAKASIDQLEAKAKDAKANAEIGTINGLKTAKGNIARRIQDLKTTSAANVSRAKAEIDSDVALLRAGVDEVAAKVKSRPAKGSPTK